MKKVDRLKGGQRETMPIHSRTHATPSCDLKFFKKIIIPLRGTISFAASHTNRLRAQALLMLALNSVPLPVRWKI